MLIGYYDKLYDAHTQNSSGAGSGTGSRPGAVIEAVHPYVENLTLTQAVRLSQLVG